MRRKITELINVKSIVTIMMTSVFCAMSFVGRINSEQFITVFTVVISFYFGTQAARKSEVDTHGS